MQDGKKSTEPEQEPPEVTLARLALEVDSRALPPLKWKTLRDAAEAVPAKASDGRQG